MSEGIISGVETSEGVGLSILILVSDTGVCLMLLCGKIRSKWLTGFL